MDLVCCVLECLLIYDECVEVIGDVTTGGGGAISPELDAMLVEFMPVAFAFVCFIFAVCLFKFIWAIGRKTYQFINICF
jgi:hypothetical protein